jgi:hypothetical protein
MERPDKDTDTAVPPDPAPRGDPDPAPRTTPLDPDERIKDGIEVDET